MPLIARHIDFCACVFGMHVRLAKNIVIPRKWEDTYGLVRLTAYYKLLAIVDY